MYIKLNWSNTVSWSTIFSTVRTILQYNITSVNDLTAGVGTPTAQTAVTGVTVAATVLNSYTFTSTSTNFSQSIQPGWNVIPNDTISAGTIITKIDANTPSAGTYTVTLSSPIIKTGTTSLGFRSPPVGVNGAVSTSGVNGTTTLNVTSSVSSVSVTNVSGASTLTGVSSISGITMGMLITGTNVQAGTTVIGIAYVGASNYTITMSLPSSGGAITSASFAPNIVLGQLVNGTGIGGGTYVSNYNAGVVTLSKALTATAAGTYTFTSTNFNDSDVILSTDRANFDPTNSDIVRTTAPGMGYGYDSVPWCYYYTNATGTPTSTPNSSNYQDIVFQRSVSSNTSTKYYVRMKFDGLHLHLTPFRTAVNTDTWLDPTRVTAVGSYFNTNTTPSLTNGGLVENCIGYNMSGATSFFMYLTPTSMLVGGKGPTGSGIDRGWLTTANRPLNVTFSNTGTAYNPANNPSLSPSLLTASGNIPTAVAYTTNATATTWTPTTTGSSTTPGTILGWQGSTGTVITVATNAGGETRNLAGWAVTGTGIPPNMFVHSNTTTSTTGNTITIYLMGGSYSNAGGLPSFSLAAGQTVTFTHPANSILHAAPEGSRFSITPYTPSSGSTNLSSGVSYYARPLGALTLNIAEPVITGQQVARSGATPSNITFGVQGLSALRTGNYLIGNTLTNTTATTMSVDGYWPHNPNSDAASLYSGQAHFGPAFVSEYTPFDASATVLNNNIPILFNGGYYQAWDQAVSATLLNVTVVTLLPNGSTISTANTVLATQTNTIQISSVALGYTDISAGMLVLNGTSNTGIPSGTTVTAISGIGTGTYTITLSNFITTSVNSVTFNYGTAVNPFRGAAKAWFGMSAQDFLWGDANHVSSSYRVLNLRKTTPNLSGSWSQDTLYAPVYIGTDLRTIERAPLGDINTGAVSVFNGYISGTTLTVTSGTTPAIGQMIYSNTVTIAPNTYIVSGTGPFTVSVSQTIGSSGSPVGMYSTANNTTDRTLAAALTDQPGYKFPDSSRTAAYGLFPLVWSNSSYNMAGGKLSPVGQAGFMIYNGDYYPDDYFVYTPSGGSSATYAIWPLADGYSRRLGLAVPKS